jgi:hypothetical protein
LGKSAASCGRTYVTWIVEVATFLAIPDAGIVAIMDEEALDRSASSSSAFLPSEFWMDFGNGSGEEERKHWKK